MVTVFIVVVVAFLLLLWIRASVKAAKDPDVKEASRLGMSILHYRKYKEIFDEQCECHRKGITPPNRMNEIPNMNEWRRYGEAQLEKEHEKMLASLDELRNRK